jgi:hypothetical protein
MAGESNPSTANDGGGNTDGNIGSNILKYGSMALGGLGALFGGGGEEQLPGNLHMVDPAAVAYRNRILASLMGGGMDTGFGANIKQGTSQLQQMMAQRGIKVGSGGAYTGAYGNMVGTAASNDANERYKRIYQMLGQPIQTATVTGANFIPGSVSHGQNARQQEANFYSPRTQAVHGGNVYTGYDPAYAAKNG